MSKHHGKKNKCGSGDSCRSYGGHCAPRARFTHVAGANACSTFQNVLTCCKRKRCRCR